MRPDDHLPLRPVEFQILASLAQGERHGYAIFQEAEDRGEGRAVPGLVTLYRAIVRLEENGFIARVDNDDPNPDDERRRVYGLTELGRVVVQAEAQRLAPLVALASRSVS